MQNAKILNTAQTSKCCQRNSFFYQLETIMITNEMLTGLGVVKLVKTL